MLPVTRLLRDPRKVRTRVKDVGYGKTELLVYGITCRYEASEGFWEGSFQVNLGCFATVFTSWIFIYEKIFTVYGKVIRRKSVVKAFVVKQ